MIVHRFAVGIAPAILMILFFSLPGNANETEIARMKVKIDQLEALVRELVGRVEMLERGSLSVAPQTTAEIPKEEVEPLGRLIAENLDENRAQDVQVLGQVSVAKQSIAKETLARALRKPIDLASLGQNTVTLEDEPAALNSEAAEVVPQSADEHYRFAFGHLQRGDYEAAEQHFRAFLEQHYDHRKAADAQYWIGESLYSRGLYQDAATAFLRGYEQFPTSRKAADSLLKLGLSLNNLGEKAAACKTFSEVLVRDPKPTHILQARAEHEIERNQCA